MKPLYGHPHSWSQTPPDLDGFQAWAGYCLEGARERGYRSLLVQASMGLGKTVLAAKHAKSVERLGRRVVFLCHLKTLVEQAEKQFQDWGVDVEVEQGKRKARSRFNRPCHVIASKDSLHPARMEDFLRRTRLDSCEVEVIADEAHLFSTNSWLRPVKALHPVFTIGLSGTPMRLDGKPLVGHGAPFEALCCRYDFLTACRHGNLVAPVLVECSGSIDLRGIAMTRRPEGYRDYDPRTLTERINERLGYVCRAAKEHIQEFGVKRFLGFLPDVGTCRAAERMFSALRKLDGSPYRTRALYGDLPDADQVKRDYHDGLLDGLWSCQMLDVGFDDPPTDGIILANPSRSAVRILQQGGRGSRLFPGKERYVIIGFRWETDDEGPQSTLDLLLRGVPDQEIRRRTQELLRSQRGLPFLEAVEQAEIERRQVLADAARNRRDLLVACVDAPVDHAVRVFDLVPGASGTPQLDRLTIRQLKQCGLKNPDITRLTSQEADSILEEWFHCRDASLCSYAQAMALIRNGHSLEAVKPLTKQQARGLLFKSMPPRPGRWSHAG
jgi:superfamily II DNA or RNA helicase